MPKQKKPPHMRRHCNKSRHYSWIGLKLNSTSLRIVSVDLNLRSEKI